MAAEILSLFVESMTSQLSYVVTWFSLYFQEEKKVLERELARVKVSANRVATVVANEWKDEKDKVMPVKQWLEERRILQVLLT